MGEGQERTEQIQLNSFVLSAELAQQTLSGVAVGAVGFREDHYKLKSLLASAIFNAGTGRQGGHSPTAFSLIRL